MAELIKQWPDGGSLSVTYDGGGAGSATFSSNANEGLDTEMPIFFKGGDVIVERKVKQIGLRESFELANGDKFTCQDGVFGVLKSFDKYTQVVYIESDGNAYIDLGVVFKNTDECYLNASLISFGSDKFVVAPSKWNNNTNRFGLAGGYSVTFGYAYGGKGTNGSTLGKPKDNNRHIFSYKDKAFGIDDMSVAVNVSSIDWGGDTTELRLFYGYSSPTQCRVYGYKQKRDGVLIVDLIPALDLNDTPCMYDKVSDTFLYNKGTGNFIVGYN